MSKVDVKIAYLLAVFFAIAYVLYIYPLSFLGGHTGYFDDGGDATQHVMGWLYYRNDVWRFPILKTTGVNYPGGTSVAFTDSIPLAAIFFKLFFSWLPNGWHYIGIWHAFAYVLQSVASVFLIRSLGIKTFFSLVVTLAFALTWPALTWRAGHTALMSHGLIIFSLSFYLLGQREIWTVSRSLSCLLVLAVLALLVHPYLFAMISAVYFTLIFNYMLKHTIAMKQALLWFVKYGLAVVLIFIIGGYISGGASIGGYGQFSMNVKAPFCGGVFFQCTDVSPSQGEGYNYLGIGTMILAIAVLSKCQAEVFVAVRRQKVLVFLLLLFFIYAVSNEILWGASELISYPLPRVIDEFFGIFRASGRFFWPTSYAVLFGLLYFAFKYKVNALIVVFAVVIQAYDTTSLRANVKSLFSQKSHVNVESWGPVFSGLKFMQIYPVYGCSTVDTGEYAQLPYIAAHFAVKTNTAYTARSNYSCKDKESVFYNEASVGYLYVETKAGIGMPSLFRDLISAGNCALLNDNLFCRKDFGEKEWLQIGLGFSPVSFDDSILQSQEWSAKELPFINGKLDGDKLVVSGRENFGFLNYGPYVKVSSGKYIATVNYSSSVGVEKRVAILDVVGKNSDGVFQSFNEVEVFGTSGERKAFDIPFEITDSTILEVRTRLAGEPAEIYGMSIRENKE